MEIIGKEVPITLSLGATSGPEFMRSRMDYNRCIETASDDQKSCLRQAGDPENRRNTPESDQCSITHKTEREACYQIITKREDLVAKGKMHLEAIRMQDRNQTTGAATCLAELHFTLPDGKGSSTMPVNYNVETLSDGNYYITVMGLR